MSAPPLLRRALGAALVTAAVAGAVTAGATSAAGSTPTFFEPVFARTDSRQPHATITTGDALVGAHRDDHGRTHVSKSYFTFDVSRLRGTSIISAELNIVELSANDCSVARATELWTTKPTHRPPTWANQPKEVTKLVGADATSDCTMPAWLGWDVAPAVRQALADGQTTLTLVLRMAGDKQNQVAAGRTYRTDTGIAVNYNTPPNVPANPRIGHYGSPAKDCGADTLYATNADWSPLSAYADVSDPDGPYSLSTRAAFWSVADPAQRREVVVSGQLSAAFPQDLLVDSGTYAWQARAEDEDGAVSAWTAPCQVTIDNTRPAAAPAVTSTDYPNDAGSSGSGGVGIVGDFAFSANGDTDVVAFEWSGFHVGSGRIAADQPGGSATASIAPTGDGRVDLSVVGVDRAGNRSDATRYSFSVTRTAPEVAADTYVRIGEPLSATFTATQAGARTVTYRLDELAETTVPVGSDGTASVAVQVPTAEPYSHQLSVWTTNAAGQRSAVREWRFSVNPAAPTVAFSPNAAVISQRVTVTFTPGMPDVVSYTYTVNDGAPTTVDAAADGTATFEYPADTSGFFDFRVFSTSASGVDSGVTIEPLIVLTGAPEVTSAEYPGWETGGPGAPGTFRFSSQLPNVAEYRYTFADGEEQTVAAGQDGSATVEFTPTGTGMHELLVRAVSASGLITAYTNYTFIVDPHEVSMVTPSEFHVGVPADFELTATLAGSTEFVYRIDGGAEVVVPAVDGKATVPITFDVAATHEFAVRSRTADGYQSGERVVYVPVWY
jgi:hypothetical protein